MNVAHQVLSIGFFALMLSLVSLGVATIVFVRLDIRGAYRAYRMGRHGLRRRSTGHPAHSEDKLVTPAGPMPLRNAALSDSQPIDGEAPTMARATVEDGRLREERVARSGGHDDAR